MDLNRVFAVAIRFAHEYQHECWSVPTAEAEWSVDRFRYPGLAALRGSRTSPRSDEFGCRSWKPNRWKPDNERSEIRTSGLMSGDGKRGGAHASVLAPILDSTKWTEPGPVRAASFRESHFTAVYRKSRKRSSANRARVFTNSGLCVIVERSAS